MDREEPIIKTLERDGEPVAAAAFGKGWATASDPILLARLARAMGEFEPHRQLVADAERGRKVRNNGGGRPRRNASWQEGLPKVREYLEGGETLKRALELADGDLHLIFGDPMPADMDKARDDWYRRALKDEAKSAKRG